MRRSVSVQTEHYRGYQIETRDALAEGWIVRICAWDGAPPDGIILRAAAPLSLAALLSEARGLIDAACAMTGSGLPGIG